MARSHEGREGGAAGPDRFGEFGCSHAMLPLSDAGWRFPGWLGDPFLASGLLSWDPIATSFLPEKFSCVF